MASSGPKYQVLRNEEDEQSPITEQCSNVMPVEECTTPLLQQPSSSATPLQNIETSTSVVESPPPYDGDAMEDSNFGMESPPLYTDIVKLPTYNESENIQETETEELDPTNQSMFMLWLYGRNTTEEISEEKVGSHVGFIFGFLISFIFNWIGFLISYCMSSDLSSHYGAISGFGLSLVKWGFLMRHSQWSKEYVNGNPWFFYIFVLFGWMIFLRGIVAYVQLNRSTRRARNEIPENHFM